MSDQSFVRTEMLGEQPPPSTSVGVVGWIRENLFPNTANSILTLVALAFIVYVLSVLIPWIFLSETGYDSLKDCRQVFAIEYGKSHGHACWSVISERWVQLLYGFYPADSYWRPNLALIILIFALAPVLYADRVPRQMIWITLAYPFIMPWLMWGGSIVTPLLVLAGVIIGYVLYRVLIPIGGALVALPASVLAVVIWLIFLMAPVGHSINKMIAAPRLDSIAANHQAIVDDLTPKLAEMDETLKAMGTEILAGDREKDALFKELEELEDSLIEEGNTKAEVRDNADYVAMAADFMAKLSAVSALKAEQRELARERGLLDDDRGDADSLVNRIAVLPETEAKLPELQEALEKADAELPDKLRGVRSEEQIGILEIETTTEETDQFRAFLAAESELNAAENLIEQTYADAGRIGLEPVTSRDFGGFMLAILIGVVAIGGSLPIGIVLALGRQSDMLIVKSICVGFIEFIRGVPLITLLFVASVLLNYFLPPGTEFDIIVRVMIMVTLFASAYMAEVIRGGLAALPKGQYEGADSLGLDYWQAQRLIIMPQALKISIPGIVSNFIGVFKDTVLVSIIGLLDPLGLSQGIRSDTAWNGIYWELFAFIALLFFIVCFGMSRYSMYLERKLQTDHR